MIQSLARVRAKLHSSTLDVRLAQGVDPAQSPELSRRARLLTSDRTRHDLAAGIERVVEAADAPAGERRRAVPLQRAAIRETRTELLSLARELAALDQPANARGIARVRRLLTDAGSPLYACPDGTCASANRTDATTLDEAVRHARASLTLG